MNAAEIIKRKMQSNGKFQIIQLFRESIGQSGKPSHRCHAAHNRKSSSYAFAICVVSQRTRHQQNSTIYIPTLLTKIGSSTGQSIATVLQNLLIGFLRGLKDTDPNQHFRAITLCESNRTRFAEMKNELYRFASTPLFDDVEITLEEVEVPPSEQPAARVLAPVQEPVYAMVRQEGETKDALQYRASILGAGMKAAVVSAVKNVS